MTPVRVPTDVKPFMSAAVLRTQSDRVLIDLAREGHELAFAALLNRYRRELSNHARKIVPADHVEDVLQAASLAAWRASLRGVEVREPRAWLHRIVHNAALRGLTQVDGSSELSESLSALDDTELLAANREEARAALAAVAGLPERQRRAFELVALADASGTDAAAELGMSEGSLRQLVHRARTNLRSGLAIFIPAPLLTWALHRAARHAARKAALLGAGALGTHGAAAGAGAKGVGVGAKVAAGLTEVVSGAGKAGMAVAVSGAAVGTAAIVSVAVLTSSHPGTPATLAGAISTQTTGGSTSVASATGLPSPGAPTAAHGHPRKTRRTRQTRHHRRHRTLLVSLTTSVPTLVPQNPAISRTPDRSQTQPVTNPRTVTTPTTTTRTTVTRPATTVPTTTATHPTTTLTWTTTTATTPLGTTTTVPAVTTATVPTMTQVLTTATEPPPITDTETTATVPADTQTQPTQTQTQPTQTETTPPVTSTVTVPVGTIPIGQPQPRRTGPPHTSYLVRRVNWRLDARPR